MNVIDAALEWRAARQAAIREVGEGLPGSRAAVTRLADAEHGLMKALEDYDVGMLLLERKAKP